MKFTVNASDFNAGMSLCGHAAVAHASRAIFESILLETEETGLSLTATDGEMIIRTRVNAQIAEEGVAMVPVRLFGDLLRKLKGEVTVSIDRNFNVEVQAESGCSNTCMQYIDASDFPDVPEVPAQKFRVTIPQNRLREAITRVMFAVSQDETRRILTGCLMEVTADEIRFIGLDGYRLAMQRISGEFAMPEGQDLVAAVPPGRLIGEFARMLGDTDEPATITCSKTRLCVSFGSTECYATLLTGEYIDYRQILPKNSTSQVILKKDEFVAAIERASLVAREAKNNLIRLTMRDGEMLVTANSDHSSAMERIVVQYPYEEFKIAFNARYLVDVVRNLDTNDLKMEFKTNVSPAMITPVNGNNYLYLVLPVRVVN